MAKRKKKFKAETLTTRRDQSLDTKTINSYRTPYIPQDRNDQIVLNTKKCRGQLIAALNREAIRFGGMSPMARVAKLFYNNDKEAIKILKHILPELKSIDAKIDQASPLKLILNMSEDDDVNDEDDVDETETDDSET